MSSEKQPELKAALRTFSHILERSSDIVCTLDESGCVTQISDACEPVLGYRPTELVGRCYLDFIAEEDRGATELEVHKLQSGLPTHNVEARIRRPDGSLVPVLWLGYWSPEHRLMFCIGRDISTQRSDESLAQAQNKVLQLIAEDAPPATFRRAVIEMIAQHLPGAMISLQHVDLARRRLIMFPESTLAQAYQEAIDDAEIGPGGGAYARAAYGAEPVIVSDIAADSVWIASDEPALAHELCACWSFPIVSAQQNVLRIISVYFREPRLPLQAERELLDIAVNLSRTAIERWQLIARLTDSEQRYRSLFEHHPDAVFSFDLEGRFTAVNESAAQLTDHTHAELIGRSYEPLVAPEDLPLVRDHFRLACTGQPQTYEAISLTKNGNRRALQITNLPIIANGSVVGVYGIAKDLTDLKRAQRAQLDRDRFFRLSRELFLISTLDARIVQMNPSAPEQLGYDEATLLSTRFTDFVHPEDLEATLEALAGLREGKPVSNFINRYRCQDGHYKWLRWNATPIGGGMLCAVGHDISDLVRKDQQLEAAVDELRRSNHELQNFSAAASHDLQEPLRKIQAFADRLRTGYAGRLDAQGLDYLERMLGAAQRMQALIDNLLNYADVTLRAQPFQPVDLAATVREVLSDLETVIEQAGAQIEVGPMHSLSADPTQMRQLLQNLLSNALKFRRPDVPPRVRVHSELVPASAGGASVCRIVVEDNGIGFDEKYRERIFQPFQRLHGRAEYGGTGIGLAIVHKIVERHDGEVTALSRPQQGTTFIVTLPLRMLEPPRRQDAL
jgi:PAS domain S-box-containing protein